MAVYKRCYFLFLIGGIGYPLLEILWRGYTHPSMGVVGGLCLIAIYFINIKLRKRSIFFRALCCGLAITFIELISVVLLNIVLRLGIWDYSGRILNVMGQICLPYFILWFLLSFGVIYVTELFKNGKLSYFKRFVS